MAGGADVTAVAAGLLGAPEHAKAASPMAQKDSEALTKRSHDISTRLGLGRAISSQVCDSAMSRRSKRTDSPSDKAKRGRPAQRQPAPAPEVMLARRPASIPAPAAIHESTPAAAPVAPSKPEEPSAPAKRGARIIRGSTTQDDAELERRQLLARLLNSEGPAAVTRAANAYQKSGFTFPEEQLIQLKLLEHSDETQVCRALDVLTALLDQQSPIKLPIFEQRLKRLEEGAENPETRRRAGDLRRALRT
jgi:hypothetical protein